VVVRALLGGFGWFLLECSRSFIGPYVCLLRCCYVVASVFKVVDRVLLGNHYGASKVFQWLLGHCYVVARVSKMVYVAFCVVAKVLLRGC